MRRVIRRARSANSEATTPGRTRTSRVTFRCTLDRPVCIVRRLRPGRGATCALFSAPTRRGSSRSRTRQLTCDAGFRARRAWLREERGTKRRRHRRISSTLDPYEAQPGGSGPPPRGARTRAQDHPLARALLVSRVQRGGRYRLAGHRPIGPPTRDQDRPVRRLDRRHGEVAEKVIARRSYKVSVLSLESIAEGLRARRSCRRAD